MSQKNITNLTRSQLINILGDILEHNHQLTALGCGYCPWCGAEEFPIDKNGEPIRADDEETKVDEYDIKHESKCAVVFLESIFDGTYKYVNEPSNNQSDIPNGMREAAADVQHQIWAHWMKYVFSICPQQEDGSVIIPADKVERWKRQVNTPYQDLSEKEKESDRHQADKVLSALNIIWGM